MARQVVFVLGDQLSHGLSALRGFDPAQDVVLMAEVAEEGSYVPHHKQKIALILSAMRHFAQELAAGGFNVDYIRLDDPANTHSLGGELARARERHRPEGVVMTEPGEWRLWQAMQGWGPIEIREDDRFLCSRTRFAQMTTGRMEAFYRQMRRQTGLLMAGDQPLGGQWNFDPENRKPLPRGAVPPRRLRFAPDANTQEVIQLVESRFSLHFGDLAGFGWPVTRDDALQALAHFLTDALPAFGDYQDAMRTGEDFLFHSLIAPALNIGLLTAAEVCAAAEAEYHAGRAPLNAVEGFVRQILGWREYVRGIYWSRMPGYAAQNALEAGRDLPAFYWTGETPMRCMAECIGSTRRNAYAHHIQRLMVTGNFALLAGIEPAQVAEWYLAVYADAFEWVELPNVLGMALFADGGRMASKPYAASGAYINRMSDYCKGCAFDPKERLGPRACPFNALYWNFLITHEAQLAANPRMAMPYRNLAAMDAGQREALRVQAEGFLAKLPGRWRADPQPS